MMPLDSWKKIIILFPVGVIFLFLIWGIAPPSNFPKGAIVTIREGDHLGELSRALEHEHVINSSFWLRSISTLLGGERRMKAGQYYFERPQSVIGVAWRIMRGDYRIKTIKVTIPEGFTVEKISALFEKEFNSFDNRTFERQAPEGYLFPDTYFVSVTATASSTIKLLHDNFVRKIFPVMPEVETSGKTLEEIITMASLIEGETNNQVDREIVSGILWKRINLNMPLQVDVEMKTYEFAGLPQFPINNPGMLSIQAALRPTTTSYLYYLTGKDGKMHYAKTFDEHQTNIRAYLR